jgi:hypothetical protein
MLNLKLLIDINYNEKSYNIIIMKKLLLILCLLAGMIALSSCSDDNDKQPDLGFGDLPASSQEFLAQYFPDNKVVSVSFDFPISLIEKSTGGNTSQETIYIYMHSWKGIPLLLFPTIMEIGSKYSPKTESPYQLLKYWMSMFIKN